MMRSRVLIFESIALVMKSSVGVRIVMLELEGYGWEDVEMVSMQEGNVGGYLPLYIYTYIVY